MDRTYAIDKQVIDSLIQNFAWETLPMSELNKQLLNIEMKIRLFRKKHLNR